RKQVENLQRNRIEEVQRNLVVGKRLTSGAARVAGERVVNGLHRAVRVDRLAEIAGAQRGVGDVEEREQALPPVVALERSEEEHLVVLDRAAERRAIVVG